MCSPRNCISFILGIRPFLWAVAMLGNEGWMSCEVRLATLCLKNIGGSGEEMDAVYRKNRTKSVVLDMR